MTDLVNPSPEDLSSRRRALRKQRRLRNLQNIWRVFAIMGLTAGSIWLMQNPFWLMLRSDQQITIEGNKMLAEPAILEVLALEYPQPLLKVQPEAIAERLRTQSPIAAAQVERQLFPPRLEIMLQERQPVAVTIPSKPATTPLAETDKTPSNSPGLIDPEGYWMAQDTSEELNREFDLPQLRVRGFHPRHQPQWSELYTAIQRSPVPVTEVDWRSPNNLILKTEIGTVHLGIYDLYRLREQLATLPKLRTFTSDPQAPAIDFIDLSNPQVPAVKLSQAPQTESSPP